MLFELLFILIDVDLIVIDVGWCCLILICLYVCLVWSWFDVMCCCMSLIWFWLMLINVVWLWFDVGWLWFDFGWCCLMLIWLWLMLNWLWLSLVDVVCFWFEFSWFGFDFGWCLLIWFDFGIRNHRNRKSGAASAHYVSIWFLVVSFNFEAPATHIRCGDLRDFVTRDFCSWQEEQRTIKNMLFDYTWFWLFVFGLIEFALSVFEVIWCC